MLGLHQERHPVLKKKISVIHPDAHPLWRPLGK